MPPLLPCVAWSPDATGVGARKERAGKLRADRDGTLAMRRGERERDATLTV